MAKLQKRRADERLLGVQDGIWGWEGGGRGYETATGGISVVTQTGGSVS